MSPLEHVGALYVENQRLLTEYRKLLELLDRVQSGKVGIEFIDIDLPGLTWAIMAGPAPDA